MKECRNERMHKKSAPSMKGHVFYSKLMINREILSSLLDIFHDIREINFKSLTDSAKNIH